MTIKQRLRVWGTFLLTTASASLGLILFLDAAKMHWRGGWGQVITVVPSVVFGVAFGVWTAIVQTKYENSNRKAAGDTVVEVIGHEIDVVHVYRCAYCGKKETLWLSGEECKIRAFALKNNAK